jgi:hypothetical protein
VPLAKGEVVGLACIRELMEAQTDDISILHDAVSRDASDDDDASDLNTSVFYSRMALDYLDKILHRHDRPTEEKPYTKYSTSTDLVLAKKDENLSEEMKLTEMKPNEIGDGTVIFDPKGDAWVVSLWTDKVMDLKQGNVTKANVKPSSLEGWTFDGVSFDDRITALVEELVASMENPSAGAIAAEVAMREKSVKDPLHIIKEVNRVLAAA